MTSEFRTWAKRKDETVYVSFDSGLRGQTRSWSGMHHRYDAFDFILLQSSTDNMRLIIIADESVYEHEVDPSVEVQDVIALVEAEVS